MATLYLYVPMRGAKNLSLCEGFYETKLMDVLHCHQELLRNG